MNTAELEEFNEALDRIAELEETLRDMVRYDQWAELSVCDCCVCGVKRRARKLLRAD